MGRIYSTRFQVIPGLAGTGPSVVVPVGQVYVVRQVTWYASAGAFPITGFVEDDDTGAALAQASWAIGESSSKDFECRLIFEAGQGFHFQIDVDALSTDSADVGLFGYALTD